VTEVPLKILTCHTEGCGNGGFAIPLHTDAEDCFCGVCGERITDVIVVTSIADLAEYEVEPPVVREVTLAVTDEAALSQPVIEETP
jgi:hypothetical protein